MHNLVVMTDLVLNGVPLIFTFYNVSDARVQAMKDARQVDYIDSGGAEYIIPFDHIVQLLVSATVPPTKVHYADQNISLESLA
jgi:hypothetical protein